MTMTNPSPEKIVEDKNTILSVQEKGQLKEYMKKNPTEVQKQAILSLENNFKIKELLNTKKPSEMNREQIAVIQLYANLKGQKITIDGVYGPNTTLAINHIQWNVSVPKKAPVLVNDINKVTEDQKVAIKKSVERNMNVPIKDSVDMSVAYLSHQQWSSGAEQILNAVLYGKPLSSEILKNMKWNIWKDFKDYTWFTKANMNAKNFFTYRYKKFNFNLETQWNAKTVHDQVFAKVSKETWIAIPLLKAIVYTESGFDANANKWKSTQYKWLMQLWSDARKMYGVSNPFDPYQNMIWGIKTIKGNMNSKLVGLSNNLKSQWVAKVLWSNAEETNV